MIQQEVLQFHFLCFAESTNVELDEKFEKVRAITKRKVMLIREIPETHREVSQLYEEFKI